jgi:hypothetical protein
MVYSLSLSPTLGRQLGLTVYQLLREVLPVMIPETAPRPMGSPTDFVNSVKLDD